VRVGPGYAIDEQGRELVLAQTLEVTVREAGATSASVAVFVLVMSYQADTQLLPRPDVDAVCLSAGLNPRNERPVLAWRTPDEVRFGPEVPLAAAFVNNGALIAPPVLTVRRYAARQIRPHVGFATITPTFKEVGGAVAAEIDTSEAGFTTKPTYVARLDFDLDSPFGQALVELLPFAFIQAAEPTRFLYVIPIRRITGGASLNESRAVSRPRAPVIKLSWLGFEAVSGCEPHLNPFFFFNLAGLRLDARLRSSAVLAGRL